MTEDKTIWDCLSYKDKLELTEYIFKAITSDGPGSFRKMIYGKLGFNGDAYVPLYRAGGMLISNALYTELMELEDGSVLKTE